MVTVVDYYSRIKLQLAIALLRDLKEYHNGDVSRFARMVDGKGRGILSYKATVFNVKHIVSDKRINKFYPLTCRAILGCKYVN